MREQRHFYISELDADAQKYDNQTSQFRYNSAGLVTIYTTKVDLIRKTKSLLSDLDKQGITINADEY